MSLSARARWPARPGPRPSLAQCLLLAGLLHLLLALVVGSAPPGSARQGQGVWGALNITLQGVQRGAAPVPSASTEAYTGPKGDATQPRWGGRVRESGAPAPATDQPGAAELGTWNPVPTERTAGPQETQAPSPPTWRPPSRCRPPPPQRPARRRPRPPRPPRC
ncbi:hypothetical protein BurJ1DRAFT_0583 [Burkholderiales bacterium JOSHI_001]|nr:hypothetical protein BurJ1DRAFT_0583 [Burkholderiales bacterium JOSHI_001]